MAQLFNQVGAAGQPGILTAANGWKLIRWDYPAARNFLRVS